MESKRTTRRRRNVLPPAPKASSGLGKEEQSLQKMILERQKIGLIRIQNGKVQIRRTITGLWKTKTPNLVNGIRYRYQFRFGYGRYRIYAARLVYLLRTKKIIPVGVRIDHKDGNSLNDDPSNLQIHSDSESNRQGSQVAADLMLSYLREYFYFISVHGRSPDDSELFSCYSVDGITYRRYNLSSLARSRK